MCAHHDAQLYEGIERNKYIGFGIKQLKIKSARLTEVTKS